MNLDGKRLVFVTGKGGVGKSVCAASIAWSEARKGRKVCLFELGNHSFYESFFQTRGIGYEPSEVVPDVHISLLTVEGSLKEYILHFLRVQKLYDVFFQNKIMKTFLNVTPALSELAILGKLTSEIRGILKHEYDLFVVDCYSTGHALALFRAPKGLMGAFRAGPLYDQSFEKNKVLCDQKTTHFVVVTLAEEMPVIEAQELVGVLKNEFNAGMSLICNQLLEPPLTDQERNGLLSDNRDADIHSFLEFLKLRDSLQSQQLKKLKNLGPPLYGVPLVLDGHFGQDYIEKISKYLDEEWISKSC